MRILRWVDGRQKPGQQLLGWNAEASQRQTTQIPSERESEWKITHGTEGWPAGNQAQVNGYTGKAAQQLKADTLFCFAGEGLVLGTKQQ